MAGFVGDGDGEAGVGRDFEGGFAGNSFGFFGAVKNVAAAAADDFHEFGGLGGKVIFTWENDAESFGGAVGEDDGVRDDFAVEVDVGVGDSGDVFVLHGGGELLVIGVDKVMVVIGYRTGWFFYRS